MRVADIQRFCMHDGPGVRTTVFLKGCPLGCAWCHNPETQSNKKELLFYENKCIGCMSCGACTQKAHQFSQFHTIQRDLCIGCGMCAAECPTNALEIIGRDHTVQELLEIIEKDRVFYGKNGGVTISGGEPFLQAEETFALLKICKENGVHTAVETCGYFPSEILNDVVPVTDLFLWDIKDTNSERHKKYTGVSNEQIINNLYKADSLGARICIRCILINGINTTKEHYDGIVEIYHQLTNCEGVEFLPYHAYGGTKTAALGKTGLESSNWIPAKEQVEGAKTYLRQRKIFVF